MLPKHLSAEGTSLAGFDIVELDEVDSTNSEGIRRADRLARPTWVFAYRQTAGRGRRGKPWVDPVGNFAATLVMRPGGPVQDAALRSFVAALALRSALAGFVGLDQIGLKWPNDVLLNGGKVAGILLESSGRGGRADWLVVGIGVNLRQAPEKGSLERGAVSPVSVLEETGVSIDPRVFLDRLAEQFVRYDDIMARHGFAAIRAEWLKGAVRLGQTITARTGTETFVGVFQGIDDAGALLLHSANGAVAIPAAEVFF